MILRAQVTLRMKSGIPADFVTNSWCIETDVSAPSPSDIAEYTTAFKDFYDDIATLISVDVFQNAHIVKYIELETTVVPNYPYAEDTFDLASNPSNASFPQEVALCLSMQGFRISGTPQARRRGRVYIGPIATATMTAGRPSSTARTTLATSAQTLVANLSAATLPATLSIWSVTDQTAVEITEGWVDDAYDTQRRRGVAPTTRTTFTV